MPSPKTPIQLEGYEIKDRASAFLGEGTYGTVYKARETATGRWVAIKKHHDITHEQGVSSCVLRETTLLRLLKNSPYVVRLHDTVHVESERAGSPPKSYMIFEHLDCDLHAYATRHRPVSSENVQRIMYHILLGLHHCHSIGMMHRDLKPHNILLDLSDPLGPIAKLADFGFGRTFTVPIRELTEEIITLWYRPPEVLLGYKGHSPAVDIWSTACLFAELYEHVPPFDGTSQYDQLVKIFGVLGTPVPEEWKTLPYCTNWHEFPIFRRRNLRDIFAGTPMDAIDLLDRMLVHDPAKRPSAEECLRHPYFASIFAETDLKMTLPLQSDLSTNPPKIVQPHSDPALLPSQGPNVFHGVFGRSTGSY